MSATRHPTRSARRGLLYRLAADARGGTIIEFAMISVPFFALMIAILQTSLTFFVQQTLDTVAEKSVRILVTGAAQKANMTASDYKALACKRLPPFFTCSKLLIDVRSASRFSSIDTRIPTITYDSNGNPTNLTFEPGDPGQITIVRMMYVWDVAPGPLGFDLSTVGNNKRLIVSTQVFKGEIS
ncbi:TadE/TadG family type IV pilus assembly protein [Sphingomonas floccifaciens]|uniref:TadE/TadG family type IV pilus assembly protein n=1 Tax=Sphingomonas floccifaciens TaxID=1844115 RepID=A0ABW4ND13_9SPHN